MSTPPSSPPPRGILKRPGEGSRSSSVSKGDLKIELTKEDEERIEELEKSGGRRTLVRRATQWRVGEQEEEHAVTKDSSASGSETPKTPKGENPLRRGGLTSSRGSGTSEGSHPSTPRGGELVDADRATETRETTEQTEKPPARRNSGRDREKKKTGCAIL